jgi:hypothetical protein
MIDKLIEDGEKLETHATKSQIGGSKNLRGIEYETWAARAIIFLEKHHANSSLTKKAIENTKVVKNNNYEVYQFLLGILKALKES